MTTTTAPAARNVSARCTAVWTNGRRRNQCTRNATGADGLCTRCRNVLTPKPYTCRACGKSGLLGPSTCAEHQL